MILSRLFPREARGATVVAKRLSKSMGRPTRHTLRMALREAARERAMDGTVQKARA